MTGTPIKTLSKEWGIRYVVARLFFKHHPGGIIREVQVPHM